MTDNVTSLERILGYHFNDVSLLERALTHSTFSENNNQILEFLGDSLLDFVVADLILTYYPHCDEGFATKKRAEIVNRYPLADYFDEASLIKYFRYSNINLKTMSVKLKSDVVEAIIGAIYADGGLSAVRRFIYEKLYKRVEGKKEADHKSALYEYAAKNKRKVEFTYKEQGEDHAKTFYAFVYLDGIEYGGGFGKKKIEAEQIACKVALEKLKCIV